LLNPLIPDGKEVFTFAPFPNHMNHLLRLLLPLFLCISTAAMAQEKFTLSGVVKDAGSGETIIGVVVTAQPINKGAATNLYGFYSLTLPEGTYDVEFAYIGYESRKMKVNLNKDTRIDVELGIRVYEQTTVVIEAEGKRNTESTDIGKIQLEMDQVKKLPVLFGEVDILKTVTLLPGVKSSGEGNAGFYVRGGGIDQNLILLDNAVVYNASHLFGFFSVFNADAVKNLELTKGGMPASFGGRLASVLDVNLKEGNAREYHGAGGIGTIASRFTVEGPIKKDTSSFIVSGRRTYIDVLLKPFVNPESPFAGSGYYFYDLNLKVNYRLSDRDQLFLSGYFGRDVFNFRNEDAGFSTRIPWGNATATARWNRILNDKLFMNTILTFTDYKFEFGGTQEQFSFGLKSGIRDYGAKVQWSYYPNPLHSIKWGVDYTFHEFTPNNTYARSGDTEFDLGEQARLFSHETAVYVQDEFDVNEFLRINAGIRFSHFIHVGPFKRYVKGDDDNLLGQPPAVQVVQYGRGDRVADYSSIKAGYMHNYQYIHLTSLSPSSLPTDVWLPSTDITKPQIGDQISAGYFRNFDQNRWESSVEIYYKTMQNQSEYRDGAQPDQTINDNIDNLLVFGQGRSYGLELFLKKRAGDLNGWIGYTWSRTERTFDMINGGEPFPARWDRRHDASFVLSYKMTERLDLGFVFVYATGNAITLPLERYIVEGRVVDIYGARNSFRMAPYHRADVSATLYPKKMKQKKDRTTGEIIERPRKFISSWNFSVYNLYNRMNPYFIYFGNDGSVSEGTLEIKAYQVSLFPILPSVTWNFEF
jgi:hypothetical protein